MKFPIMLVFPLIIYVDVAWAAVNEQRDMWYRFHSDVKEEEKLIGTLEVFHIIVNLLGNLFPLPLEGQTDDKCLIIAAFDTGAAGGQQFIKNCDIEW